MIWIRPNLENGDVTPSTDPEHGLTPSTDFHSASPDSQRSAVAAWFGEIPMTAKSPVGNLTRPAWRAR
jgi:hypothetical protein